MRPIPIDNPGRSRHWSRLIALVLLPLAAGAQSPAFLPGDSLKFMAECHNALDVYQTNLENVGVLAASGGEMLEYKQTLLRQCFYKPTVMVYSDLGNEKYTADEYASQVFNQRTEVSLNLGQSTYRLNRLPDGRLEIVAYVEQSIIYGQPKSRQKKKNRLSIHYSFAVFAGANGYEPIDYQIVKIEKAAAPPDAARPLPKGLDIDSLRSRERDLGWVARRLAISIREKLPKDTRLVRLQKFAYSNSNMTNEFSDQLLSQLRHRLKTDDSINTDAPAGGPGVEVRGHYTQKADVVEVITELFDLATGKAIASLRPNTDLSMNWVRDKGLILKPDGTDQAIATQQTIAAGALAAGPPKPDKLSISLNTTLKGTNREFWESDTMFVQIRVNKPGHVRLLYVQADGSPALLWPDYEVKPGDENKAIFFPSPFLCVPPFGQETLVAVASTVPFCPLKVTRNMYDVDVVDGSLADAMKNVRCTQGRGFARIPEQAESRLTLTTRASKTL